MTHRDREAAFAALRDDRRRYNWYLGTPEALISAGVIEPHMLDRGFPASHEINGPDEFGIRTTIRKCADGRLRVIKSGNQDGDRRAVKTIEAAVGALVADLLRKFERGTPA